MTESFAISLKRSIMKKKDQIKLKKRSKETNFLLIRRKSKTKELPRTIQKVNRKKKRLEKPLNKLRKRLEYQDLRIFYNFSKIFMKRTVPLTNLFRNFQLSLKSWMLKLRKLKNKSKLLVSRVLPKKMKKEGLRRKRFRRRLKKRSKNKNFFKYSSKNLKKHQVK